MDEVVMENRAWKGVRLVSEPIREGEREYIYTIGWHVPVGMFYLEEQLTRFDRKPVPETIGRIIAYSKNLQSLIRHIEKIRNVTVKLEENVSEQEKYAIAEGERILRQYPKWKTEPDMPVLH